MMKSKHTGPGASWSERMPRGSIQIKIILSIIIVSLVIITALWALEALFLEQFYIQAKRDRLTSITKEIMTAMNTGGYDGAVPVLERLSWENSVCISINNTKGFEHMFVEGLGDNCYLHMNTGNRFSILRKTLNSPGEYQFSINTHPAFDVDQMTCAVRGTTQVPEPTDYLLAVTVPLTSLKDVPSVIQQQILYIAPFLLVGAVLFAFLIARSLVKPLNKLSQAVRRIAEGSLNVTVDIHGRNEIGELARNFNTMSREISKVNILQRELVANISHDIRTPLTMIKGYAEMIKDISGEDPQARNEHLDIIVDEANRLSKLVSDVMDLSLMQAGQTAFHPHTFDITAKVRDILGRYRLLEETSGFEFTLEAARPYLVEGDETRIEQVLYNLLNNAVNHIGPVKRITVRIGEDAGDVKIEVEDTGTGIRQEDLPLIWDRYFKPYKKGEKQSMGTGLGLSIVKAILVNHHSRFGVNSTLGVGSTFWFTLSPPPPEEQPPSEPA